MVTGSCWLRTSTLGSEFMNPPYKFTLELRKEDASPIGKVAIDVDFEPALEWARFLGVRRGFLTRETFHSSASLVPIWHQRLSEPYISGFSVRIVPRTEPTPTEFRCDFDTDYFTGLAEQARALFIEQGKMEMGESYGFLASAYCQALVAGAEGGENEVRSSFQVEETTPPLAIREGQVAEFKMCSREQGKIPPGSTPVFMPQRILGEAAEMTRNAGTVETGGILIGHLRQDRRVPETFVEVTGLIPARHAEAELTKLTFTAETWTAVRAAVELRKPGEIMLGWFHSHPVKEWKCKECPVERQKVCGLAKDFLSAHDRALHRTVFPRAWCIALVANDVAFSDVTFSMFGWDRGGLTPRGFHVMSPSASPGTSRGSGVGETAIQVELGIGESNATNVSQ